MILFDNDYTRGAHEAILQRLMETNRTQTPGYGLDHYTKNAQTYVKKTCGREDIDVHLLSAGTQTNTIIISAALRPHQGVITADTGHILNLEAGAIEAVGHKLLPLPNEEGKLTAEAIEAYAKDYAENPANFHHVQPGMVYLSNPTEKGTLYSKAELEHIREICDAYNMLLFIDGARLGYGLVAETNDLTLKEITDLCDVFYIGGTKQGALFGEAVVLRNDALKEGFRTLIKQKGGLLAKGRVLGIQFETLFEDNLYFDLAKHGVDEAMRIKRAFKEQGISLKYPAHTNQLFPVLTNNQIEQLQEKYSLLIDEELDEPHRVVRLCTSWGTDSKDVDALIEDIKKLEKA